MRKIAVLLFLFSGLGMSVNAQLTIPTAVTSQFQKMFENVTPTEWKEDDKGSFVAYFKLEANDAKAVFSANAEWIKTVIFITEDELPDVIFATIKATFEGDFTFKEVEKVKTPKQMKYEAEVNFKGETFKVLLDESGNLMKKESI